MRLDALSLLTVNLPVLRAFYGETLGLAVVEESATALSLRAGRTWFTFEQAPPGWAGFYHFAFNIPTNLFASARAWLSGRAALLRDSIGADEFDFASWNARACYFDDPAGNIVEFIARHDIDEPAPEPFAGRMIQCISEIGLVSDDVPAAVGTLRERLGVQPYRGAESETFTALGDEHGLFICVKDGREWFPDKTRRAVWARVRARVTTADGRAHRVEAGDSNMVIREATN